MPSRPHSQSPELKNVWWLPLGSNNFYPHPCTRFPTPPSWPLKFKSTSLWPWKSTRGYVKNISSCIKLSNSWEEVAQNKHSERQRLRSTRESQESIFHLQVWKHAQEKSQKQSPKEVSRDGLAFMSRWSKRRSERKEGNKRSTSPTLIIPVTALRTGTGVLPGSCLILSIVTLGL